jgi:hypothetical protein
MKPVETVRAAQPAKAADAHSEDTVAILASWRAARLGDG